MQTYFGYFENTFFTQDNSITLLKTSMFIWMQKINFIIHFFLTILRWNINNNIRFHYRLFPRKTNMTKFFEKSQKPYFGPILDPFAQIWAKNEFSWKKVLCQFFNIRIIYCVKNQKNLMSHSSENCWKDTPKTSLFH